MILPCCCVGPSFGVFLANRSISINSLRQARAPAGNSGWALVNLHLGVLRGLADFGRQTYSGRILRFPSFEYTSVPPGFSSVSPVS